MANDVRKRSRIVDILIAWALATALVGLIYAVFTKVTGREFNFVVVFRSSLVGLALGWFLSRRVRD